METIGVIGLGIIGTPWAARYQAAGKLAGVWNRTPKPEAPAWKATAREVADAADITHIVVADPPAVSAVLDAILPALGKGKAVVQSSTIDPASAALFEARVCATGARYVESPFTGSKPAAEAGTLVGAAAQAILESGARVHDISVRQATLEQVFIYLTGKHLR